MHDSARAIQFLRTKATEWNIDPQRIACTGGSAGAGIPYGWHSKTTSATPKVQTHLTKDDPPVFAMNNKANEKDGNIHHPNFGRHLKQQMDKIGTECEFHLTSDFPGQQATTADMLAFVKKNFGMKSLDN